MSDESIRDLFDAATTEVPARYQAAPLVDIAGRVRHRRARLAVTAVVVTLAVLVAGFGVAHAVLTGSGPLHPAVPFPSAPTTFPSAATGPATSRSPDKSAQPWSLAMVARDDRTVTVYSGTARCHELSNPTAQVTAQDAQQVVIAVHGRVVDGADCTSSGTALPVTVTLPAALGTRTLYDAATIDAVPAGVPGTNVAVYHERDLPDVEATGWAPFSTQWQTGNKTWRQGYNGPNGSELQLVAGVTGNASGQEQTVKLGAHDGTLITMPPDLWQVRWQVDGVAYSLEYLPSEGGQFTRNQFTELLAGLHWD